MPKQPHSSDAATCSNCPTPTRRNGLPCGECPICGVFWVPCWDGTSYGIASISREDYQRWLAENGYGVQPNGATVPVPALQVLPNVQVRYA